MKREMTQDLYMKRAKDKSKLARKIGSTDTVEI